MKCAIVLLVDKHGYDLARYAMTSIIIHQNIDYDLYLFCRDFEPHKSDPIFRYALEKKGGRGILLQNIDTGGFEKYKQYGTITNTSMLKLNVVSKIHKDYDRVLYVDHDVLFFKNLPIETVDMGGFALAAITDVAEQAGFVQAGIRERAAFHGLSGAYFNSGVMLFDCEKFSEGNFLESYHIAAHQHEERGVCHFKSDCKTTDQCCFNLIFDRKWRRFPLSWNTQSCLRHTPEWDNSIVRHYNGSHKAVPIRPWRNDKKNTSLILHIKRSLGEIEPIRWPELDIFYKIDKYTRKRGHAAMMERTLAELKILGMLPS